MDLIILVVPGVLPPALPDRYKREGPGDENRKKRGNNEDEHPANVRDN